jgi:hypothetical protein
MSQLDVAPRRLASVVARYHMVTGCLFKRTPLVAQVADAMVPLPDLEYGYLLTAPEAS